MPAVIKHFFDAPTFTFTYVVHDSETKLGVVIDPVLNYEPAAGKCTTESVKHLVSYLESENISIEYLLETHIHADHLSGTSALKNAIGGKVGIGSQVVQIQETFADVFNVESSFAADGSEFDVLFEDDESFTVGKLQFKVWHTPGHTPACVSYLVEDSIFVGDTLFMPDYGTARTDFPAGSAQNLYHSIQRILSLPDQTRIFLCHDYGTESRPEVCEQTTVEAEKLHNIHIGHLTSEEEFVKLREARDAKLSTPALLYPSVQFNMRSANFPPAEKNGVEYFKIPLTLA
ncbi:MBL fold metallo-hydrolase [Pseudomonadales bacterium]|nr:MBL fold metallo-hydrolase [Pseudomonadales bacterium]|tara:strand:- start:2860 stop:3723 length:864 start_codon:yes stop_codon:yes gene_type:complete